MLEALKGIVAFGEKKKTLWRITWVEHLECFSVFLSLTFQIAWPALVKELLLKVYQVSARTRTTEPWQSWGQTGQLSDNTPHPLNLPSF